MGSISLELTDRWVYMAAMAKELHHPDRDQIDLSAVLEALSEPTRREIVLQLLERGEAACQAFESYAPKTNLSYHYARLREAGVTRTRLAGPYRMISVRVDDLAERFPGLLDSIIKASRAPKGETQEPADAVAAPATSPR
jgi:DNA-binding transcriptional ArsR family regulator